MRILWYLRNWNSGSYNPLFYKLNNPHFVNLELKYEGQSINIPYHELDCGGHNECLGGVSSWVDKQSMVIIFMSIVSSYCEIGWGGFGSVLWYGVIRECRVDYSKVKVLKHRFGRHNGICGLMLSIELWYTLSP